MEAQAHLWHYFAALPFLAFCGLVWHLARALWRPIPERLTGHTLLDLHLPTGYRITDIMHQVEFDEDGYYVLESWRNLRVAIGLMVFPGMIIMIASSEVATVVAGLIDQMLAWFVDLVVYRWENVW